MKSFFQFLKECLSEERRDFYTEWGWVDPKGAYHDGLRTPGTSTHDDFAGILLGVREPEAIRRRWIRFYVDKGGITYFSFSPSTQTIWNVMDAVRENPHVTHKIKADPINPANQRRFPFPTQTLDRDGFLDALDSLSERV